MSAAALPRPRRQLPRRRRRPQSYGVSEPGAYATTPAWWSREHWRSALLADLRSDEFTQLRAAVGTRGPVSARAVYAVAVALSASADGSTGRNALPGNAALTATAAQLNPDAPDRWTRAATSSGYALTTVQKAVQVLGARGWLVLVRTGKNYLTRSDRTEMRRAGATARRRRNVWACTVPPYARRPTPYAAAQARGNGPSAEATVDNSPAADIPADAGCDLPTTRRVRWVPSVSGKKNFNSEPAGRTGAPRRAPSKAGRADRAYRTDLRVVRLAKDLRARVPWLRHVPHQRIMPSLHRFALAGWTARGLQTHLDRLLELRGWTVPGGPGETVRDRFGSVHHRPETTMRSPWGYLAFLLRHLDLADLMAEQEHAAHIAACEQYQRQLIYGVPCPHGQPAGDVASTTRGVLACPMCRHDRR